MNNSSKNIVAAAATRSRYKWLTSRRPEMTVMIAFSLRLQVHLSTMGKFFFRKNNISALSAVSRLLFSPTTLETVLNNRSLSTLVQGAQRNLTAVAARAGKRCWLILQYWKGLSDRGMVCSAKYVCIWLEVLVMILPAVGSSCSSKISSNRLLKLHSLVLVLGLAASRQRSLAAGSPTTVDVRCSISSIFSTSRARASFADLANSFLVKYLKNRDSQRTTQAIKMIFVWAKAYLNSTLLHSLPSHTVFNCDGDKLIFVFKALAVFPQSSIFLKSSRLTSQAEFP